MGCDICNKKGVYLESVVDKYKTDDIQQVCDECKSELNNHIWKLRSVTDKINQHWIKRFMKEKKINLATKG
jgi:hypothetical protein